MFISSNLCKCMIDPRSSVTGGPLLEENFQIDPFRVNQKRYGAPLEPRRLRYMTKDACVATPEDDSFLSSEALEYILVHVYKYKCDGMHGNLMENFH